MKVTAGMFKLYEGEVLGKLPVIQHFLFGTLVPCSWNHGKPPQQATTSHNKPQHAQQTTTSSVLNHMYYKEDINIMFTTTTAAPRGGCE